MAQIIDGKALAQRIKDEVKAKIAGLKEKPGLAVILVGSDPASKVYVNNKEKDCIEVGMKSDIRRLPAETKQEEILSIIDEINAKPDIHGLIVQLPLPEHLDEDLITNRVASIKDVDGLTYESLGKLLSGSPGLMACTPAGCIEMIKSTGVDIKGKNAVVIGRSNIVGKPMAILLLREHATVTVCHSRTVNLPEVIKRSDIVVAAIGRAKMIKADMIKPGAIVIDVGMNKDENGKLCGDVDFEKVKDTAGFLTPVPGGVGPMTRAMLIKNTLEAYHLQNKT